MFWVFFDICINLSFELLKIFEGFVKSIRKLRDLLLTIAGLSLKIFLKDLINLYLLGLWSLLLFFLDNFIRQKKVWVVIMVLIMAAIDFIYLGL